MNKKGNVQKISMSTFISRLERPKLTSSFSLYPASARAFYLTAPHVSENSVLFCNFRNHYNISHLMFAVFVPLGNAIFRESCDGTTRQIWFHFVSHSPHRARDFC